MFRIIQLQRELLQEPQRLQEQQLLQEIIHLLLQHVLLDRQVVVHQVAEDLQVADDDKLLSTHIAYGSCLCDIGFFMNLN